jgi:predicted ATPase
MLAYHFAQAAMPGPACAHFELAGDRAAARTAYAEAIAHFRAGLVEAGRLAPGPERSQRELKLLLKLGPTLALLVGSRHPEVEELYRRAQAIAESLKDESAYFKSTWGLWFTAHVSRNVDTALARAEELVALGRESSDADQLLEAIHCRWATSFIRGDVTASLADSREGVERYDPARHAWMGAVFGGHDPGVCAHVSCAGSLALAGCPEPARKNVDRALALAESLRHPPSLSQAYQTAMVTYQLIGDPAAVRGMAKRMLALADKYDFTPQHAHARFMDGWAIAASEPNAGIDAMEAEFASVSSGTYFRYYAALLAEALLRSGRTPEAHALILTALATVTKPGVGFYVPELYRLQGECLLRLDEHHLEEAVRAMQMAIDTAREHGALLLEQKATAGLAHARGLPA